MWPVFTQALRRRRTSLAWWALGIAAMAALLAVAYPTVRDNTELDTTFANLPPGVEALLGLSGGNLLSSPAGYLNSQFVANILPVMLLVLAIGTGAATIAGDEAAGTLELLLANPISRVRVALARLVALAVMLAALAVVCTVVLVVLAPSTGLNHGLSVGHLTAAIVAATLTAFTFGGVAFAVGATTGRRGLAVAVAAGLAVAGYVLHGLAAQVAAVHPTETVNPWHWLLSGDPLRNGLTWHIWLLPLATVIMLGAVSLPCLARRDLR
ncbi:MAG TPA: ABC transporter permease subunit [Micromonosporaceae bacterium]